MQSPFRKDEPHFSFDGKWLAYTSDESGRYEVYVISFPEADQKRQISTTGGSQPRWRQDGKELYYFATDGKMMAVPMTVSSAAGISSGVPQALFDTEVPFVANRDQYAVTADGKRFLILKPLSDAAPTPLTVVLNWSPTLR